VSFFKRLIVGALSLALAAYVVPGIYIDNWKSLLVAAFLSGIVNAVIRPLVVLLTLPFTIVTLGLFLIVINAGMFALVAWVVPGFYIKDFTAAVTGWLIVVVTSFLVTRVVKKD